MQSEFNKWGNSLAIRIPSQIAKEMGIEAGSMTYIRIDNGRIIITPASSKPTLRSLLDSMRKAGGREAEIDMGEERGREVSEW